MGFALKKEYLPRYTYEDYLLWEGQWELIDGVPYAMSPSPSVDHQRINGWIFNQLLNLLENCGTCEALLPIDWKVNQLTVVQPDVSVACQKNSKENYLDFPPTVIFEILSPSTSKKDQTLKYELYESEGVKYYVIVSPKTKSAEIFEFQKKHYKKALTTKKGQFTFELKECSIDFDFSQIWP